jgi:TPR repeat protein
VVLPEGRGIPVDFTVAAECFKRAAGSDDADGVNCFGCCLERGHRVDPDPDRAVAQYRRAASLAHPDALYNFGRCLEYGKGIARNLDRAAKYYRLSADQGNTAAQNSFGICVERGIGAHKQALAAQPSRAMRMGQTISDSASSTAAAFSKTSKWRPIITNLRPIAAIAKQN